MKTCLISLLLFSIAACFAAAPPKKQAQLLRTVAAQVLGSDGFPKGTAQLSKGVIFDVVEETFADVIGTMNGRKFRVSKQAVTITEKEGELKSTVAGFKPGQLVILSARYSLEGNQPRNVKTRLQKYLPPDGILTEPFVFLVTDDLSLAAENQKTIVQSSQTAVVVTDPRTGRRVMVTQNQNTAVRTAPNTLVVEYTFNGRKGRKVGMEGKQMTLP